MIERNWNELIRPEKPQIETGSDASRKARIVAEPLERGFGVTLGDNPLEERITQKSTEFRRRPV